MSGTEEIDESINMTGLDVVAGGEITDALRDDMIRTIRGLKENMNCTLDDFLREFDQANPQPYDPKIADAVLEQRNFFIENWDA